MGRTLKQAEAVLREAVDKGRSRDAMAANKALAEQAANTQANRHNANMLAGFVIGIVLALIVAMFIINNANGATGQLAAICRNTRGHMVAGQCRWVNTISQQTTRRACSAAGGRFTVTISYQGCK